MMSLMSNSFFLPQGLTAEVQQAVDDLLAAHRLTDDDLDILPDGRGGLELPGQQLRIDEMPARGC